MISPYVLCVNLPAIPHVPSVSIRPQNVANERPAKSTERHWFWQFATAQDKPESGDAERRLVSWTNYAHKKPAGPDSWHAYKRLLSTDSE